MIFAKSKLGSEQDKTKQLFIENGYPEDALLACFREKLANFSSEKQFRPEKYPVNFNFK